jgi:hypothetical protein
VTRERAPCVARPQGSPAGAHGRDEFGLLADPEKALELAGKIRVGATFNQRRGAHREQAPVHPLAAPELAQSLQDRRGQRAFVEPEAHLNRQTPRVDDGR